MKESITTTIPYHSKEFQKEEQPLTIAKSYQQEPISIF